MATCFYSAARRVVYPRPMRERSSVAQDASAERGMADAVIDNPILN
jgi:hypothetical protein